MAENEVSYIAKEMQLIYNVPHLVEVLEAYVFHLNQLEYEQDHSGRQAKVDAPPYHDNLIGKNLNDERGHEQKQIAEEDRGEGTFSRENHELFV